MSIYRHRQVGVVILWSVGLSVAGCGLILALVASEHPAFALIPAGIMLFLVACMVLFGTLTVEVSQDRVELWFGPGWIRKRFPVEAIRRATVVRNHWYYGWGIRLTPHGWLYNVSGYDAVEIELTSGQKYRIGTDEPQELLSAIRRVTNVATEPSPPRPPLAEK